MNLIEVNGQTYELQIGYQENNKLRKSFNELAENTFGLNFENWYLDGYWTKRYIPYSLIKDDQVIANVSVNVISFDVFQEKKQFIQIGTVMTHGGYRNQQLSKTLMEVVLNEWEPKADLIYLFANNSVLDYYPKFGFVVAHEYEMIYKNQTKKTDYVVEKLDMKNVVHREKLFEYSQTPHQLSVISMQDNAYLVMFYCTSYLCECIYEIKALDVKVIAEYEGEVLIIHDVFSHSQVSLSEIVAAMQNDVTKVVKFGFMPCESLSDQIEVFKEEETTLFVKGNFATILNSLKFKFPTLSHA